MLPGFVWTRTTVTDDTTKNVDSGDIITGNTTVGTVTDAAVDDADAGALTCTDTCPAAVVHHAIGHDHRGLVVDKQTTILLTVRENAEIHKQSEAFV